MSDANRNAIGLVGLGRMGSAIGQRLLDLEQRLVVWNRTPERAAPLVARGAVLAADPAEVAALCGVVLVILRDGAALREVYRQPGGLAAGALAGVTVVDMTTAPLADIAEAARQVQQQGGRFIDAPISGTIEPARRGELVFMVGGDAADLARIGPVLERLGRKTVHVGPVGSGIVMKLVLNLPLATYWQTLGEALAIGQGHGLAMETMLDVLVDSKAAIGSLRAKLPQILDAGATVQFDLDGLRKDLVSMRDAATALQLHAPAVSAAAESATAAVRAGWGARDLAQLVRFVADQRIGCHGEAGNGA
jgi:3-hydroxyisobutyrate dehydrogenase